MQDGSAGSQWPARILITANTGGGLQRGIRIAQMFVRLAGLVLLVLGIVIWTGHGDTLIRTHAALGVFFVLALWTVAAFGLVARIGYVLPARLIIWGIVIGWFGISQQHLFPDTYHWIVRVLHLAVGIIAIGLAEVVSARVKKAGAPKMPA
jgi:hypothetical protein